MENKYLPVLCAEEDGVWTDPVLLQREKVYFSVGLDGSSFMSLSGSTLPLLARIVKLAVNKHTIHTYTFNSNTWLYNIVLIRVLRIKDKKNYEIKKMLAITIL